MKYKGHEVYQRENGDIAVLVSKGFGSGWSTECEESEYLAYDKRVVEFYLQHKGEKFDTSFLIEDDATRFFKSIGEELPYMGGFSTLEIQWVPEGIPFQIRQYDGNEYIEWFNPFDWTCFGDECLVLDISDLLDDGEEFGK